MYCAECQESHKKENPCCGNANGLGEEKCFKPLTEATEKPTPSGQAGFAGYVCLNQEIENFIHDKYGYCRYAIGDGKKPVIFNLYIEPEFRRLGHARKHLKYVINEIRKTGYEGVIGIEVSPREDSISSEKLVLFYKSIGLEIIRT